jgi:hypothetical protein
MGMSRRSEAAAYVGRIEGEQESPKALEDWEDLQI